MGAITNSERDFIVSGLRGQTQKLENLINQLEDKSNVYDGNGWDYGDLINIERSLRNIRKVINKIEYKI